MDLIAASRSSNHTGGGQLFQLPLNGPHATARHANDFAQVERPIRMAEKQRENGPTVLAEEGFANRVVWCECTHN